MGYERNGRYYRDENRRPENGRGGEDYRERSWRGGGDGYDHYRARDDRRPSDFDDDRGFFDRAGDEVRSWFGDEEAERRRRWDERLRERDEERRYASPPNGAYRGSYGASGYGYPSATRRSFSGGYADSHGGDFGAGRGAGATSSWGLGAGRDHDGWGLDPNYEAWRRRQVAELDRDYADYRRENESRFNSDFGSWRTNRQGQRQSLNQAKEHQEVVGSDGSHVGTVDHIRGDRILLTKSDKDAGGHHHSIPAAWIAQVDDKVTLNRTAAQAQAAWQEDERSEGPHYLNRAFPGTY